MGTQKDSAEIEGVKFIADFIIMTGIINLLLNELLKICVKKDSSNQQVSHLNNPMQKIDPIFPPTL